MTASRNYRAQKSGITARATRTLVLCLLLPPVGLLYMWRAEVFRVRGRIFLTLLAFLQMTLLFTWGMFGLITWNNLPDTVQPEAGVPVAVTHAPVDDTVNALSNISELISGSGSGTAEPAAPNGADQLTQQQDEARIEEIMNTTVYSVNRGAKYYHKTSICGNQTNSRELTVREALSEYLGVCPDCKPPVP